MSIIIPSSPDDRAKVKAALEEITHAMTLIAAQKDHIKEIIQMVKENYDLEPKYTRKMAKALYDSSFVSMQTEQENFELLYENIIEEKMLDVNE